jgi:hypothetical protein
MPDLSNPRKLRCKAWVYNMSENPKIFNCSTECVLVGYSDNLKAYHCWDCTNERIHVTRNITFTESQDLNSRPLHPGVTLNFKNIVDANDGNLPQMQPDQADAKGTTEHPELESRGSLPNISADSAWKKCHTTDGVPLQIVPMWELRRST